MRGRLVVIGIGVCVMLVGAMLLVAPWLDAARWQASPEAARAARNADAPTPVWLTPTAAALAVAQPMPPTSTLATPADQPVAALTPATAATSTSTSGGAVTAPPQLSAPITLNAHIDVAPTATPAISDLTLGATAFAFDDPPEPGAHAHLTVTVHNPTDESSGPIVVSLPKTWLSGYRLEDTTPEAQSGVQADGALHVSFDAPGPGDDVTLSLQFVTTDEVIDSPTLTVFDADGRKIGQAHPATEAPTPRPGPIYSIDIPRLSLHTGVVPVDWEPPLFVVGQLRTSAYVTMGNSVLVGHVRGAPGYNVFDHLDELKVGDQIIASSRGASYTFTVSDTQVLPEDDTSPTEASSTPRLTLMTCAGDWNPITRDYSDRLWVIAEPDASAD